jgi:hypothetical protein
MLSAGSPVAIWAGSLPLQQVSDLGASGVPTYSAMYFDVL